MIITTIIIIIIINIIIINDVLRFVLTKCFLDKIFRY